MKSVVLESDGLKFYLTERKWEEYHGITAAVITLNEENHIVDYLKHIKPLVKRIVMIDGGSLDRTVELATPYVDTLRIIPFPGHFAKQKNAAIELCHTDWILFLDPDERMDTGLYNAIPGMIEQNEIDCYKFPRKEFVDGVENDSIYPDYQARLFRSYCRFIRPIHEELVGYKVKKNIDMGNGIDLIHLKTRDCHVSRNKAYPVFALHYMHEMGQPGEQTEDTVVIPLDLLKESRLQSEMQKKVIETAEKEQEKKDV